MTRRLALLVSLLTALPALAAPGDRPWTSDDVLGLKVVTDPQVSPDGRLVAYVVESLNGEKDAYQTDVWLVPVGVPTNLLVLPRQPHGIREPKLLRTCQERFLDWTEKYTR